LFFAEKAFIITVVLRNCKFGNPWNVIRKS